MIERRSVVDHVLLAVVDLDASRRRSLLRDGHRQRRHGSGRAGRVGQYSGRNHGAFVNDLYGNKVDAVWHAPEAVGDAPIRRGVP
jgi:hypothetical protein